MRAAKLPRLGRRQGLLVPLPLLLAGVDLVVFSRSHEEICRAHVARHGWLRLVTFGGYPAWMFATTGVAMVAGAVWLGIWIAAM